MAGEVRVENVNISEQTQDCGCGCGGAQCSAAGQDCGCGCGGLACGAEKQEIVFVGSVSDQNVSPPTAQQCDGSCGCRG